MFPFHHTVVFDTRPRRPRLYQATIRVSGADRDVRLLQTTPLLPGSFGSEPPGESAMTAEIFVQPQATETAADKSRSILIIEDDPGQRDALIFRLSRIGYRVRAAGAGREGLAMAREDRPHLVLLDLRLPDMEGFALGEALADDPATCGVPVIVLSAMERPDIIRRTRAAGCQYFVRKPYDPNALLVLIESAIDETGRW
jgi:CheY-like chemotaxis protein